MRPWDSVPATPPKAEVWWRHLGTGRAGEIQATAAGLAGAWAGLTPARAWVEREQALEDLLVGEVGGPAVGGGDCCVQLPVNVAEPGRALVVELGERALLQVLGALLVPGQDAVGEAGHDLRHAHHQVGGRRPTAHEISEFHAEFAAFARACSARR